PHPSGGVVPSTIAAPTTSLPGSGPTTTTPTTTTPTTTTDIQPAVAPTPSGTFVGTVAGIGAGQVPATWRPGCPVGPAQLRLLTMSYWGFDGRPHVGTMVVNSAVTSAVLDVFARLFSEHFPIHRMQPEDAYGGQDPASMADDNTSGFNCRDAVAPGPPSWSVHAYGEAIDVNPVENPYLEGGQVQPPAGAQFIDRGDDRPGMAVPGGQLVAAFASVGWSWGGRWTSSPDYQHFSATGG
ncbi:MAG TPA: M15 family metallopeptidase, partial [Acidimicrobiales bacterium]|nr:M15 family metallopeptidase [Acidimicrobiales bacterium]